MLKATLTPPNMTPVRLWLGCYGGHYSVVVLFREKPTNRMTNRSDPRSNGKYVDCLAEKEDKNVFANLAAGTFEAWFPTIPLKIDAAEIPYKDLIEVELTVPLDEYGQWEGLDVDCDGWN